MRPFHSMITDEVPSFVALKLLETYRKYMKTRPESITSLSSLRWHLFSIHQSESNRLPPTEAAFKQMILRSHFTAMQWKSSHLPTPILPDPNEYGWTWSELHEIYEPIMTTNMPVPQSIIELIACGCKSDCSTDRCRCHKNNLRCTEMCRCDKCENSENDGFEDISEHLDEDE